MYKRASLPRREAGFRVMPFLQTVWAYTPSVNSPFAEGAINLLVLYAAYKFITAVRAAS